MKLSILQSVIREHQETPLPTFTPRDMALTVRPDVATVIAGCRRCGKTYRTHQFLTDLLGQGVRPANVCKILFNDLRMRELHTADLLKIHDAYYSLYPAHRNAEIVYFVFDEIQRIEGWEDYVLQLLSSPFHRVIVTGSTSKLLSGDFASQLRGKCLPHTLFGFSFREYLSHNGIDTNTVSPSSQDRLRNAIGQYLLDGSFPGVLGLPAEQRTVLLQSYWQTMLLRDVIEAHRDESINFDLFSYFAQSLVSRTGCPMTVRKIMNNLRGAGFALNQETGYRYLRYLQEAFALYTVPYFTNSEAVRNRNYQKVYSCDWAMASAVSFAGSMDVTRLFENLIHFELVRRGLKVHYYRTTKGHEIDFVTVSTKGSIDLVQVCYELTPEAAIRETRGIPESARHLGAASCTIVTVLEEDEIVLDGIHIRVVPAWKWLLEV